MDIVEGRKRRDHTVDEIAEALPQRGATLLRLFLVRTQIEISRVEGDVLGAVCARPRRITELAAREGVTQPAITRLVTRLERRGWVTREADSGDGRVVLVLPTPAGLQMHERLRAEYRALLHEETATLPDRDLDTLAAAIEILDRLIARVEGAAQ